MDIVAALRWAGRLGMCFALLAAPLLVWRRCVLLAAAARRRARGGLDPTVMAGCMVGMALLAAALPHGALGFDAILGVGGYWDVPAAAMPDRLRHVLAASPRLLADALAHDSRGNWRAWLALAAALWLARLLAAIAGSATGRASLLAAEAAVLLISIHGALWSLPLLFWIANRLNVWLILVALLILQDVRHGHPPLTPRLLRPWLGPPPTR